MAHIRKGHVTGLRPLGQHLKIGKRVFRKRERLAAKRDIEDERGGGRLRRVLDR